MTVAGVNNARRYFLFAVLLSLLLIQKSQADTNVSGNITTDTTWTLANSPYIVAGTVQVLEDATLTIQPVVTVKFNKDTVLRIGGELVAEGTQTQMITFTSNEPAPSAGDWGPLEFVEGAVESTLDEDGEYVSGSTIEYCRIEYGWGIDSFVGLYLSDNVIADIIGDYVIELRNGSFTIRDSHISISGNITLRNPVSAIIENNTLVCSIDVNDGGNTIIRNNTFIVSLI